MKKFKDVRTGVIETVTNKELIEQYEKRPEIYEAVGDNSKKSAKESK